MAKEQTQTAGAVETVVMRHAFYRDNHRKVMTALLISILIIVVLISLLGIMVLNPPKPRYFATTVNGRVTPLVPLNMPNLSQSAILQWANTAAIEAFTYDFHNYRKQLQRASEYFTPEGWRLFLTALNQSKNLERVRANKLLVTAVATQAPIVLAQGLLQGRYTWRVELPMLVTYQSAAELTRQSVTVTMLITRVSTLHSARGIGIAQFVVAGEETV